MCLNDLMTQRRTPHPATRLGRPFLVVWAGQTVSTIGSTLSGVGVGIHVFVETGSATWLGVFAALTSVPYLLASPLLPLTDRRPRRSVMIGADTVAMLGPAIALLLALTDRLEIWHLVVAGFVSGFANAFQGPASQAAIPALVAPQALDRANSLGQLGAAGGIVLGPILATPLVAWWGIEAVLLADLATFAVGTLATLSVHFDDAIDDVPVSDDRTWSAVRAWLAGPGRPLIGIIALTGGVNLLLAFFNVSILVLATDLGGTARAGLVLGTAGAAMIIGSLVSAARGVSADRVKSLSLGLTAMGAGFVIAASRPSLAIVVVGVGVALGAVPVLGAVTSTIFHERVPASMQGRVFGLRSALGRSLEPIGSVAAGFVIADVAEPAMRADSALGSTIGRLIGEGETRGAALVIAAIGSTIVVVGLRLRTSQLRAQLVDHGPTDEPVVGTSGDEDACVTSRV